MEGEIMEAREINEKQLKSEFYSRKILDILPECKKELTIVQKHESIDDVLSLLRKNDHVWVVENRETMKLLGFISRVDLLHLIAPPRSFYHIFSIPDSYHYGTIGEAEDIMNKGFITCDLDDNIEAIIKKMIRHTTDKIAILSEKGRLNGEITIKSLIAHYHEAKQDAFFLSKSK